MFTDDELLTELELLGVGVLTELELEAVGVADTIAGLVAVTFIDYLIGDSQRFIFR